MLVQAGKQIRISDSDGVQLSIVDIESERTGLFSAKTIGLSNTVVVGPIMSSLSIVNYLNRSKVSGGLINSIMSTLHRSDIVKS